MSLSDLEMGLALLSPGIDRGGAEMVEERNLIGREPSWLSAVAIKLFQIVPYNSRIIHVWIYASHLWRGPL